MLRSGCDRLDERLGFFHPSKSYDPLKFANDSSALFSLTVALLHVPMILCDASTSALRLHRFVSF